MNATEELFSHVRQAFDQVHMSQPADHIVGRGRLLRRRRAGRRLAAAALAAAGITTALAVSLPSPAAQQPQSAPDGQRPAETHVHLAAWSVDSGPQDTVTVRVRTPHDPAARALAGAGVRAKVEFFAPGRSADCIDPGAGLGQLHEVVGAPPVRRDGTTMVMTIKRAAMPAGSVLHFVIFAVVKDGHTASTSSVWLLDGDGDACVSTTAPGNGPTPSPHSS
jgi:hypothetical protein